MKRNILDKNTLFLVFPLIFVSELIPIVADKVKLRDETLVADHFARTLPVSDAVAVLKRETSQSQVRETAEERLC